MRIAEKICNKSHDMWHQKAPTIAFLGDSVTQGCFECYRTYPNGLETEFDYQSAYSTRFKEILNIIFPYTQINIINAGVSGGKAADGVEFLKREVLPQNPDLIVVSFGLNDACVFKKENISIYLDSLKEIFNKALENGCEVIFMTQNYMCDHISQFTMDEFFRNLAKEFSELQNDGTLAYYFDEAKKLCKEMGIKVCDIYQTWDKFNKAGADTTELLANRLNHPKKEIHYYMALKLIETIFEI